MLSLLLILGSCWCCSASQAQIVDSEVLANFHTIVRLMLADSAQELAKHIAYPLRRENPVPDITNAEEFVQRYPVLIDSAFKRKLLTYDDSDVFEHHGYYGLVGGGFLGDIWINYEDNISALNYSSEAEQGTKRALIDQQKAIMDPSVKQWDENVVAAGAKNLLIRVDRIDTAIRYASWSHGQTLADPPDIVINHGRDEPQGTMGGWWWWFYNGEWTYIVQEVLVAQDEEDTGYFLELQRKGKTIFRTKLTLTK